MEMKCSACGMLMRIAGYRAEKEHSVEGRTIRSCFKCNQCGHVGYPVKSDGDGVANRPDGGEKDTS